MTWSKGHLTSCREVLDQLYEYLDGELDDTLVLRISTHLHECGSCLQEHEREALVMALVRRSCGGECAPEALKVQILETITAKYGMGCPAAEAQM